MKFTSAVRYVALSCGMFPVVTERSVFTFEFDFASSDKGGVPAARPTSGFWNELGEKVVRAILAPTLYEGNLRQKKRPKDRSDLKGG